MLQNPPDGPPAFKVGDLIDEHPKVEEEKRSRRRLWPQKQRSHQPKVKHYCQFSS